MAKKKAALFLVEEVCWAAIDADDPEAWHAEGRVCVYLPTGGGVPRAAFDSERAAELDALEREKGKREARNPFLFGEAWADWTSMEPGPFLDWLRDHGIEPPAGRDPEDWRAWYAEASGAWGEVARAKVWEALDRVRFFRVTRPK